MSLLAIDLGSSRCKAVAFRPNGEVIGHGAEAYTPEFPEPGRAEIDPEKLWQAAARASRAATRDLGGDSPQAICFSSHGETFVPVDAIGRAIAPAILNMDTRASAQASWCEQAIGRKRLFAITGLVPHAMYPLPKILWLREHRPQIFSEAARFLSVTDYVLSRLQLPAYIDFSLAGRFLAFDVVNKKWSKEILSLAELNEDRLPLPVPAGTIAGKLSSEAAGELGIPSGTPVVVGGHDQACGALGAGVIEKGRVSDSLGTYECLVAACDAPSLGDDALAASLNTYNHVVPEKYATMAYFPSGIMVQWFHDLLHAGSGSREGSPALATEAAAYDWLESQCPAGPSGLCIAPHLFGTCHPDFNDRARGVILGLTPDSGCGQIYKGILEGIACELEHACESLAKATGEIRGIYAMGGGTGSQLGLQLRASFSGRPVHVMQSKESVCLGAALLSGVAIGAYADIADAVKRAVRERETILPDPEMAAGYAAQMKKYRMMYSALAPVRDFRAG
jgi:xylulokinase